MFGKIMGFIMGAVVLVCAVFGIIHCCKAESNEMIQYNKDKTSLTISLEENATTGYQWVQTAQDEGVVKLTEDKNISQTKKAVDGAPTTRVFTFKPVAEGKTLLTFSYERSWENEPVRVVTISVKVNADMTVSAELVSDISE
ncbi:MAG: protease inhibitor I42 family protein [Clostridia bacterium]|nr:protease inhibitor I42 family protein [Clostridia bacterium]